MGEDFLCSELDPLGELGSKEVVGNVEGAETSADAFSGELPDRVEEAEDWGGSNVAIDVPGIEEIEEESEGVFVDGSPGISARVENEGVYVI
jgi:hypothetical protein